MNYFQSVLFCTLKITYVGFNCSIPSPTLGVVDLCGYLTVALAPFPWWVIMVSIFSYAIHLSPFLLVVPFQTCYKCILLALVFYCVLFFFSELCSKSSSGWPGTHPVAVWPWAFPLEPPRCWNFKHVPSQLLKILF